MKRKKRRWLKVILFLGVVFFAWAFLFRGLIFPPHGEEAGQEQGPAAVLENYGDAIRKSAREFHLSPEYLAALCMLESGGRKPVPFRFEKHIYSRLKMVQLRLKDSYEHVKAAQLCDAEDEALQNLASSWGPFQLMGYKCLMFDIKVRDLRGDDGVHWAAKWMNTTYGQYIRKRDYKSAFHIHNTGKPFPKNGETKTFNKHYVEEGLRWMAYFKGKI